MRNLRGGMSGEGDKDERCLSRQEIELGHSYFNSPAKICHSELVSESLLFWVLTCTIYTILSFTMQTQLSFYLTQSLHFQLIQRFSDL